MTQMERDGMRKKYKLIFIMAVMTAGILSGCREMDSEDVQGDNDNLWEEAASDPYGKYPELVTYTTGYNLTEQDSDILLETAYEDDTPENNAYTRYLRELLNIQNINQFEARTGDDYDQQVAMAVASRNIPDMMYIDNYDTLLELVENDMIEDLTDVYHNLACDMVRSAYESYGEDNNPLDAVTFDGKIMAIPKTQLADGQSFLWVRKDWMDKLNLEEPSTLEEMEELLRAFTTLDPDGNGENDTTGLAVHPKIYGEYPNRNYGIDSIFTALDAYPEVWITNAEGEAVYGSVQPEMKDALELLHKWYEEGLLDQSFILRAEEDVAELIASGKCGAYIGPWWSPFTVGQTSTYAQQDAEWINISCPVGSDGKVNAIGMKSYGGFVVVRKGYEHPEIAMKIINVNSEYAKQDRSDMAKEIQENQSLAYFNWPLYCEVQPGNNAELMTEHIKAVLDGKETEDSLMTDELAYYEAVVRYQEAEASGRKADAVAYSQFQSRMIAIYKKSKEPANYLIPAIYESTETMKEKNDMLERLEKEAVLKIIIGEADLSDFDQFVEKWMEAGGAEITEEVNRAIALQNAKQ